MKKVAFWDKKSPKKTSKKLTPAQKSAAKKRAKAAGRPYPNLVDNAAVAKKKKYGEISGTRCRWNNAQSRTEPPC